jgi:hypothetical protein
MANHGTLPRIDAGELSADDFWERELRDLRKSVLDGVRDLRRYKQVYRGAPFDYDTYDDRVRSKRAFLEKVIEKLRDADRVLNRALDCQPVLK